MATVIPAQSPGLATARQVPRAPLPTTGVTFCCVVSTLHQRELPLLHRSYGLMRQTKTLSPASVVPIPMSLCRLPPVPAGNWPFPTLSLQSLSRCLDPYPAVSFRCSCSLLPWRQRPHLRRHRFGTPNYPCNPTSTGNPFSGLQSFRYVQAPTLARPPDCTYRT
jgi:hypothetical protein